MYQYKLEILGMDFWDATLVHRVLRAKQDQLNQCLGVNVCSGASIYLLQPIVEDFALEAKLNQKSFTILVSAASETTVALDDTFKNADNTTAQNLINVVIKQAFRETEMRQIGRRPHFFDCSNPRDLKDMQMRILQGFKSSCLMTQIGCTFVVDSIVKLISTKTCLKRIQELEQAANGNPKRWQQLCREEFQGKSIISNWGQQR